jgi:hypothetical protein
MHIANWSARFIGFNKFPCLLDPEISQIVARVREVRMAVLLPAIPLWRVYVLTNGWPEWLAELKDAYMHKPLSASYARATA